MISCSQYAKLQCNAGMSCGISFVKNKLKSKKKIKSKTDYIDSLEASIVFINLFKSEKNNLNFCTSIQFNSIQFNSVQFNSI